MKLIIALGNPGDKYKNNRHNVGYILLKDLIQRRHSRGDVIKKSNVFINQSGDFVKKLVEQYHLKPSDLWVIHDDLDIPLGSYKIQKGKGPKLHKGINSIEEALGTDDFWRVRVGVDNRNPEDRISGEEYVLQDFTEEELKILSPVIEEICKKLATS
jgi:PTH1 family peptidyl-tRNA hydrolase